MFNLHSLTSRLAVSKTIGFILGALTFFIIPLVKPGISIEFKLGVWLFFMLMGAMIGFMGIITEYPMFNFKLPWWFRGGLIGATFTLMLVLLSYGNVQSFMNLDIVAWTGLESPYWIILDGTFYGIIISFITTKVSGEGDMPVK
ncbi:MAG: hypothetical protein U9Q85_04155 [Patescibacteria group bacterium]|nr:hypothetical protein [Patescibacteria group bacterium]